MYCNYNSHENVDYYYHTEHVLWEFECDSRTWVSLEMNEVKICTMVLFKGAHFSITSV